MVDITRDIYNKTHKSSENPLMETTPMAAVGAGDVPQTELHAWAAFQNSGLVVSTPKESPIQLQLASFCSELCYHSKEGNDRGQSPTHRISVINSPGTSSLGIITP